MKSLWFTFVLIILGSVLPVSGQTNPDEPIPPDTSIIIGKFPNGLTYYIKHNNLPEQRIELRLVVNAGSICEDNNQQGLAHFCEHMCFNGTKNFPSNKMVDMLEEMGVKFGSELNAYTSFDQTIYMLQIPSDNPEWVERGFQVVEDWAHQVTLSDKEIDKERGVITEEWRLGLGADERMMQKYMPVLFRGSKYAERLPIGKIETIKNCPYDTLREFYKTWYRPDLEAVIVVGDINPKVAEAKIREHFARIPEPAQPEKRIIYPIPGNKEPLISVVTDKEATGYDAEIMYKHPSENDITYADYRNALLRRMYTDMLNNRFDEIRRKPDSPFLNAYAGYGPFIGRTIDVYSLSASAKEDRIEKSINLILLENERAQRYGFTPSELEREKKDVYTSYENSAKEADKTPSATYADELIRNYLTKECIPGYIKEFELVKYYLPGISIDELNLLGRSLTTSDNMLVLVTGQEKPGVDIPTAQKVEQIIGEVKNEKVEPYVDIVTSAPLLKSEPVPSAVVNKVVSSEFGYTELTFANGARIFLKPTDYKNDEILFSSYSPGGTSLYPDRDVLAAMLAPAIVSQSGLGNYDLTGLQKKLSGNTARVTPYIGELREGVNGSCTPKDLETMLQLNYLYFTGLRRDTTAFDAYISRLRNMIQPMRANPRVIFSDTLSKIISMNSPRIIALPTEAQLKQITLDRALGIFSDRFRDAGDFTYFMVGNFKTDSVVPLLEKYIGGLPSIKRKETWRDVTPGFPKGKMLVDVPRNSEPQSLVAMVWKGKFTWTEKDRLEFGMLMDILEIASRESMREEQGGVYGVSIDGQPSKYPKPTFTITTSWGCSPDSITQLVKTMLDEMNKLREKGPTDVDLRKVKEALINDRETKMRENSFWIAALQNLSFYGDRVLTLDEFKDLVNSITVNDIKAIADKYLETSHYVEVELTPAEKAAAKPDALK
ncbi:MAG: insulinase family protein [Bacteroidales bacterium]